MKDRRSGQQRMPWFEVWVTLMLMLGCTTSDAIMVDATQAQDVTVDAQDKVTTIIHVEGDLAGILAHDVGCSSIGDGRLSVDFAVTEQGSIHIPVRPDVQCAKMENEEILIIHCRGLVYAGLVNYFDDFLFRLNPDTGNGNLDWWTDGSGYFECSMVFWIDRIVLQ